VTTPGTCRECDKSPIAFSDAIGARVVAARPALERTARTYRALITYKELAEEVQAVSGVRTRSLMTNWIGDDSVS
jgi:hypothetical protein